MLTIITVILKIKETSVAFYSIASKPFIQAGKPKLQQNKGICGFMRRKNITSEMMKQYMAEGLLMLMAQKPYDEITIGEITAKAGVNRSTYYRNFSSKDEVVKFYFSQIIYHHIEHIPTHPVSLEEYLLGMFTHYYQYKTALLLIHNAKLTHLILDVLNETFSELHTDESTENRYAVFYHTGGIYNNFVLWFSNDMRETPAEMAKIACSFLPADFRPFLMTKEES